MFPELSTRRGDTMQSLFTPVLNQMFTVKTPQNLSLLLNEFTQDEWLQMFANNIPKYRRVLFDCAVLCNENKDRFSVSSHPSIPRNCVLYQTYNCILHIAYWHWFVWRHLQGCVMGKYTSLFVCVSHPGSPVIPHSLSYHDHVTSNRQANHWSYYLLNHFPGFENRTHSLLTCAKKVQSR